MKIRVVSAVLLVPAMMLLAGKPTAERLEKCPNGHTALKNVPIRYGVPSLDGPQLAAWNKAIDNLEFVPGGCVSGLDSPKHQVVCATCRYEYAPLSTAPTSTGTWIQSSTDSSAFAKPISELAMNFATLSTSERQGPVKFSHALDEKMFVVYEEVEYQTSNSFDTTKLEIELWLAKNKLSAEFHRYKSVSDEVQTDIGQWSLEGQGYIMMSRSHSEKVSKINATFRPSAIQRTQE